MSVTSDACSQFSRNIIIIIIIIRTFVTRAVSANILNLRRIKRLTSNKKWDICHPAMRHLPSLTGTTVVHLWCVCNSASERKVCHVSSALHYNFPGTCCTVGCQKRLQKRYCWGWNVTALFRPSNHRVHSSHRPYILTRSIRSIWCQSIKNYSSKNTTTKTMQITCALITTRNVGQCPTWWPPCWI